MGKRRESGQRFSDETLQTIVETFRKHRRDYTKTSLELKLPVYVLEKQLAFASERGMLLDLKPIMPGFRLTRVEGPPDGPPRSIEQKPQHGDKFKLPDGQRVKGVSALLDPDGREIVKWVKTTEDQAAQQAAMEAAVAAFSSVLPRSDPVILNPRIEYNDDLLNQFTLTDLHFGMLSWREETGADYDLKIAEQLLLDWFDAAIRMSPDASTAILAQLGDLLHHDSFESVTPTNRHVLDADSRFQKIIRVVIRVLRRAIAMLLEKHQRVHVVMADANHDPASEAWLREMFAAFFENEPRISVDRSADAYYVYEHGLTALFYHHGHKRKTKQVDTVFAGKFREIYGRTKFAYAHTGHLHSDELLSTNLMKIERHETLAAPDAYAAKGGWLSGRSAKVITYSKRFGEVGRITITPEMVRRDDQAPA